MATPNKLSAVNNARASSSHCPTIFLINRISGIGHLDAYARLYCRAFLELGCRVALIAENISSVEPYLVRTSPGTLARFLASTPRGIVGAVQNGFDAPRVHLPVHRRAIAVWQEDGVAGILRRIMAVGVKLANRILPRHVAIHLGGVLKRLAPRLVKFVMASKNVDIARWIGLTRELEKKANLRADLVLHLYLDGMDDGPKTVKAFDDEKQRPWIGILFHPRLAADTSVTAERFFETKCARGSIFLVPAALQIYQKALPNLHFALAPDVADLELSAEVPPIAQAIRAKAGGRKVVLLAGTVSPHKGIVDLIDVIALADPNRFFFAIVGIVLWPKFGVDERKVRKFYASAPENVFVHDGYIPDERSYNSIIVSSDVIYAVYRGFNDSSNSLTKAAGLKRPILTTAGTLMGQRVQAAQIGAVAREGDPEAILHALETLVSRPAERFNFVHYAQEHSLAALKKELSAALPKWLNQNNACVLPDQRGPQ